MPLRYVEYLCMSGHRTEELVDAPGQNRKACPYTLDAVSCGDIADRVISAPGLALVNQRNGDFNERQERRILARNNEKWAKSGKDEAVDRVRMQDKKGW